MYKAKLIKLSKLIEEEVTININGVEIVGFANICPYNIVQDNVYSVDISLTFLDGPEIIENKKEKYGVQRVDDSFKYILYGKINNGYIDIGNGIKIEDEIFHENSYLNGHYVKIIADRLAVAFLQPT